MAVKEALGHPEWLEAVIIRGDVATLVITADPQDLERSEARRLEAESRARAVEGIKDANAVLTADTPASWVMEGGDILPEPGEEEAWLAKHNAKLAAQEPAQ